MPQITVRVNDRPYSMVCDEGEEAHLQELAEFLDKEVVNLKENFGQVGDSRLLMMAGIMVADKLSDALSKIETLQEEVQALNDARAAAVERTKSSKDTVAGQLEQAAERIEQLTSQLVLSEG
jgi:cell division protein ZapA